MIDLIRRSLTLNSFYEEALKDTHLRKKRDKAVNLCQEAFFRHNFREKSDQGRVNRNCLSIFIFTQLKIGSTLSDRLKIPQRKAAVKLDKELTFKPASGRPNKQFSVKHYNDDNLLLGSSISKSGLHRGPKTRYILYNDKTRNNKM